MQFGESEGNHGSFVVKHSCDVVQFASTDEISERLIVCALNDSITYIFSLRNLVEQPRGFFIKHADFRGGPAFDVGNFDSHVFMVDAF